MASAALLAAGCSTENKAEGTEYGTLKVSCTADGSIDAASDDTSRMPAAPSVPQAGDFTLTVTGESGTQKWDTLTEFEQSDAVFRMGTYTVSVAHGDPDAEGIDKPYYAAEKRVEVIGLLLVYCLKDAVFASYHALPELIAIAVTAALQRWR